MKTTDEQSGKYAWRGPLYYGIPDTVPWWQLPVGGAVDYHYEYIGDNSAKFTIITETGFYESHVTRNRAYALAEQCLASMRERGIDSSKQ